MPMQTFLRCEKSLDSKSLNLVVLPEHVSQCNRSYHGFHMACKGGPPLGRVMYMRLLTRYPTSSHPRYLLRPQILTRL